MTSLAAFHALLYNDATNAALRQVLSAHLSVGELSTLVQVCRAFRPWLVDYGAQLFLGVTGDIAHGAHRVLRPWTPHLLLNGQPAMCKKKTVHVEPRIYSCYGRTPDGKQLVKVVPYGCVVDLQRSGVTVALVHASSEHEAETLLHNFPLFTKKKPPKGEAGPYYDTYHMGAHIEETLSRHSTPPGMYRLRVVVHLRHICDSEVYEAYTYTSDAFHIVAAPPKKGSATEKARREEPYKRSRFV